MAKIRLALHEDEQEITNILMTMIGDANPKKVAREVVNEILVCNRYFSLVFDDEGIKGFVTIKFEPFEGASGIAEIAWLGVHSQERRKGVGSSITKAIEQYAKENGIRKLYVKTNPNNRTGVSFWIMQHYKFEARLLDFGSNGIDYYMLGKVIV